MPGTPMTFFAGLRAHGPCLTFCLLAFVGSPALAISETAKWSGDLYTVTFQRIWGAKVASVETFEGCYAESLVELFEDRTGFYLSI